MEEAGRSCRDSRLQQGEALKCCEQDSLMKQVERHVLLDWHLVGTSVMCNNTETSLQKGMLDSNWHKQHSVTRNMSWTEDITIFFQLSPNIWSMLTCPPEVEPIKDLLVVPGGYILNWLFARTQDSATHFAVLPVMQLDRKSTASWNGLWPALRPLWQSEGGEAPRSSPNKSHHVPLWSHLKLQPLTLAEQKALRGLRGGEALFEPFWWSEKTEDFPLDSREIST